MPSAEAPEIETELGALCTERDVPRLLDGCCLHSRELVQSVVADGHQDRRQVLERFSGVLNMLPPETIQLIGKVMRERGVLRESSKSPITVQGLNEQDHALLRGGLVRDPEGVTLQCFALADAARYLGEASKIRDDRMPHLVTAALLINSGKFTQLVGLEKDREELQPNPGEQSAGIQMLRRYNAREEQDYSALEQAGFDHVVLQILRENKRHDPDTSNFTFIHGDIVFYVLHCYNPGAKKFMSLEERIAAARRQEQRYNPVYDGYEALTGNNLLEVQKGKIDKIETTLAGFAQCTEEGLATHLNRVILGITS